MNQKNIRLLAYTVFTLLVVTAPLYLNRYWIEVLNNIGLYAILALSLNVIVGYAGMFHMGHAAFYAIGAYTTAIISTRYHRSGGDCTHCLDKQRIRLDRRRQRHLRYSTADHHGV